MDDLKKIETQKEVETWDYDVSVKKIKTLVYKWKNVTVKILHELWVAHVILSKEGRPKTVTNVTVNKTWNDYCEDIDISRMTAHRWLSKYDSINNRLIEAPEKITTFEQMKEFLENLLNQYTLYTDIFMKENKLPDFQLECISERLPEDNYKKYLENEKDLNHAIILQSLFTKLGNKAVTRKFLCEVEGGKIINNLKEKLGLDEKQISNLLKGNNLDFLLQKVNGKCKELEKEEED